MDSTKATEQHERRALSPWRQLLRIQGRKSVYFFCLLIGALAGCGAALFAGLLHGAEKVVFEIAMPALHAWSAGSGFPWHSVALFTLPVLGGLIVGWIIQSHSPESAGAGTDAMIQAYHEREGRIEPRTPFFKSIATILTLATGGSAGREGPTALIGAGVGSVIANWLQAGARARRTLMLAGTAGGLGAIFTAPFGGAMTAVEVIYKEDVEGDSLIPCIISSVTAYLIYSAITGQGTIYEVPGVRFADYRELFFYVLLAVMCFSFGYVFVRFYHAVGALFARLPVPIFVKPAIGGACMGGFLLLLPQAAGQEGFGFLRESLRVADGAARSPGALGAGAFFLLVAAGKIVATSLTVRSGGSGGIFGPSLFIGAMLGGAVGTFSAYFFPGVPISVASFMLVGMGAFFAGVARAPIAAMIMLTDMTGSYKLLPPLMVVTVLAVILSHRYSIYLGQVTNRFQSPAHYWDMNLNILDSLTIGRDFRDYRTEAVVPKGMLLSELEQKAMDLQASDFVVTTADGRYHGMVSLRRVRLTKDLEAVRGLVTLEDADTRIAHVAPGAALSEALQIILENEVDKAPIVEHERVLGYIRYTDILNIYHSRVRRG